MSSSRRNILTLMSGTMLAQALPIAVIPILSRLFSPEDFGVLAIYIAVTGIFGAVANGRYELAIMLPHEDKEARVVVALGLLIALCVSLLLLIGILLFGDLIARSMNQKGSMWWLYFSPVSVLFIGFFNMLNYYNNRQKMYGRISVSHITKAGMTAVTQLGAGWLRIGAPGLVLGRVAGEGVAVLALLGIVGKERIFREVTGRQLLATAKRYKDFPKFSMWSIFFNRVGGNSVDFFISAFYSIGMLGQYSLMQRVLGAPSDLVGAAIGQVFFQEAAEERKNTGKAIRSFNRVFVLLSVLSMCGFGLLYMVAEPLFAFVFGEQWRVAGELAKLMIPLFIFRFIASSISLINSIFEKQKMAFYWQTTLLMLYVLVLLFAHLMDGGIHFLISSISIVISLHYALWLFSMYLISRGRL